MACQIAVELIHATSTHVAKRRRKPTIKSWTRAVQNFFPSVDQTDRHAMPLSIDAHATLALAPTAELAIEIGR